MYLEAEVAMAKTVPFASASMYEGGRFGGGGWGGLSGTEIGRMPMEGEVGSARPSNTNDRNCKLASNK